MTTPNARTFALCISNEGFEASLELRRVYELLRDDAAATRGLLRVVDESGEDYLFPARLFVTIDLPQSAQQAFGS